MSKKKKLRRALKRILRNIEGDSPVSFRLCNISESVNGKKSHKMFLKLLDQFGDRNYCMFYTTEDRIAWLKLQIKATKMIDKRNNDFCYEI